MNTAKEKKIERKHVRMKDRHYGNKGKKIKIN